MDMCVAYVYDGERKWIYTFVKIMKIGLYSEMSLFAVKKAKEVF